MKVRKINQRELAELIDFSQTGLNQAIQRNDFRISTLEKIAAALNVPISYFFEEDNHQVSKKIIQNGNHNNIGTANSNNKTNTENEILLLQKEIEGLKKEIDLLREINELLKKGK